MQQISLVINIMIKLFKAVEKIWFRPNFGQRQKKAWFCFVSCEL